MGFDELYELYHYSIIESVKQDVLSFSKAMEISQEDQNCIFDFVDYRSEIYTIVYSSAYKSILKFTKRLIIQMMKKSKIQYERTIEDSELYDIPFYRTVNGKRIGYYFTYFDKEDFHYQVDKFKEDCEANDLNSILVVSLTEKNCGSKPMKQIIDGIKFEYIYLIDLFDEFWGDEYIAFKKLTQELNKEIKDIIGYQTIIIPLESTIKKYKPTKKELLLNFDYRAFIPDSIKNSTDVLLVIENNYFDRGLYKAIMGISCFADSFISSEWYYDSNEKGSVLEKTAIVTGYLKSIEQLLHTLVRTKIDTGKTFKTSKYKLIDFTTESELTKDKDSRVYYSLGNLIDFLFRYSNDKDIWLIDSLLVKDITSKLLDYKNKFRNDHFHKDNVYENDEIEEIRNQTLALYYLVLGAFNLNEKYLGVLEIVDDEEMSDNKFNLKSLDEWFGKVLSNPELNREKWLDIMTTPVMVTLRLYIKKPICSESIYNTDNNSAEWITIDNDYRFTLEPQLYIGRIPSDYVTDQIKIYMTKGNNVDKLKEFMGVSVGSSHYVLYERK